MLWQGFRNTAVCITLKRQETRCDTSPQFMDVAQIEGCYVPESVHQEVAKALPRSFKLKF
jgi:hypothetical protein